MPSPSPRAEVRRARPLLGTVVEIAAGGAPAAQLHQAIDHAFAAVQRVQALMSFHDAASEVSALNRGAHCAALRVDAQTYTVLGAAQRISESSEGAFDITVGARLQRWGCLPAEPLPPDGVASWRDVELLEDRCVRFRRPLHIDLGGIAKGYAVDCAVAALRDSGACFGLVNAGGDLRVFGAQEWPVRLRHPQGPAHLGASLVLRDEALASSAVCFSRRKDGEKEVSALLDPRSGRPYLDGAGISVRAADCMTTDALTKALLFAAPALRETLLETHAAHAYVQAPAPDTVLHEMSAAA
jgi:thiamine biosynthesis lipoprotein